ncbi:MAG: WD40 repeat domain-containing protein, partial [Chitinophagaceae bacterium]
MRLEPCVLRGARFPLTCVRTILLHTHTRKPFPMRKLFWGLLGLLAILIVLSLVVLRGCDRPVKVESNLYTVHRIYTGARAEVWTARFGPGDSLIAAASVDSTLRVWHTDGRLLAALPAPGGLTCAEWAPDGKSIAATSYDGAVYLWSWPEGKLQQRYETHNGTAWTLRFSPDGSLLASAGEDKLVVLRRLSDGRVTARLSGHRLNIWDLAFSPDGKTLASGSFDGKVFLWDVAGARLRRSYEGHDEAVVALAFSPDGAALASSSDDGTVQLQDATSGRLLQTLHTPEHQQGIAFSPDGKRLVSGGRDHNLVGELTQNFFADKTDRPGVSMRLWNLADGRLLQTFSGHADDANDVQFSRDG